MALFQYPKSKHSRTLSPRTYKNYRSYKPTLQREFSRVCVYCRQPDSGQPNLNFGVDHYRPKGINRFAHLVCSYENLYYCCGGCNSRKNNYWPEDEKQGPFVVAPCEHEMATHLRFDGVSGTVQTKSPEGMFTEELLQLNQPALVQYRLTTLKTVKLYLSEIEEQELLVQKIGRLFQQGKISQAQFDSEMVSIRSELESLRSDVQIYTGELPMPPLRKQRFGVALFTK